MKASPLKHKAKWLVAIPGAISLLVLAATPPRRAAAKPVGPFSKQIQEAADRFDIVIRNGHIIDGDRKSTRLNSSHVRISYAVFCLKKKTTSSSTYLSL